jgi:hypothetical protein
MTSTSEHRRQMISAGQAESRRPRRRQRVRSRALVALGIAWVNGAGVQTSWASAQGGEGVAWVGQAPIVASAKPEPSPIPLDSIAPKDKEMPGGERVPGSDRLGGTHRKKVPIVRWGKVTVSEGIPADLVRRVMRQNFGRFRLCYEAGLKRAPKLRGSVALHYTIELDASISSVSTEGSTVPDREVLACFAKAVVGLSFPRPERAPVNVSFEVQLFPPS